MLRQANKYARVAVFSVLAIALLVLAATGTTGGGAGVPTAHASHGSSETADRIDTLNDMHELSRTRWEARYDRNIVADACHAIEVESPVEISGSLLGTDCWSARRHGAYADYYTFQVEGSRSRSVAIDLDSDTDSYLFLISGNSPVGTAYLERDDDDGPGRDARIRRTLSPGTYTIAATTYGEYETGDYTLEVSGHK